MVLIIEGKNFEIYERVRTVEKKNDKIIYYRDTHYPGEKHEIELSKIKEAFIHSEGHTWTIS
jgi:hypothetical protein